VCTTSAFVHFGDLGQKLKAAEGVGGERGRRSRSGGGREVAVAPPGVLEQEGKSARGPLVHEARGGERVVLKGVAEAHGDAAEPVVV